MKTKNMVNRVKHAVPGIARDIVVGAGVLVATYLVAEAIGLTIERVTESDTPEIDGWGMDLTTGEVEVFDKDMNVI